jgi:hypothetical protein
MRSKHLSRWTLPAVCSMILAMLLVACGGGGSSSSTSTPTPALSPTSTSISMAILTGNGFTISYPQNWHITRSGAHLVTFEDSTGTMKLTITTVPDPNGAITAGALANTGVKAASVALKDTQTVSVPTTTTVGGETWSQGSVSGTQRLNNQDTSIQVVVLANVHPGNTPASKGYTINYSATKSTFGQANTAYFQPMLQSFKFV